MDRRNFLRTAGAAGLAGLLPTVGQACSTNDACEVANWQASRQPFDGVTSPRRVNTCVRILVSAERNAMSEVVLMEGTYEDVLAGRAQLITSMMPGAGHSFQVANQPSGTQDVFIREFCFEGILIAGLRTITFCNGLTPGDGAHHTLSMNDDSAAYLRRLQQTGHVGDFLTFLGTERSYRAPVSTFFTDSLYRRLYGAHGEWLGS